MYLFRRNNKPLIFVLLRVHQEELELLKKMILENGGVVRFNDKKIPIIFTQSSNYSKLIWPEKNKTLIYDIKFIKDCVRQRKIVNPEPYRLSEMPLYSECLMTHFLYGGCKCVGPGNASAATVPAPVVTNGQTVLQSQSQASSIAEDDFFTATSGLSERGRGIAKSTENTEDPLDAPASLNQRIKHERSSSSDRGSPNCTTLHIEINAVALNQSSNESRRSTIDESRAAQSATVNCPTELSSGDDRLTEAIDKDEKRPCSVEYHSHVEPKLRIVEQRKKDMEASLGLVSKKRQQRTPTTLTDGCDSHSVLPGPENTSAILEVMRSAPSCENEGTVDDDVTNELESSPTSPARSDASTIMAQNCSDHMTPSARKRVHSETAAVESPPESNWITTECQEEGDTNHPVSKYMRCDNGERGVLKASQQLSPPCSGKPSSGSTLDNFPGAVNKKSSVVLNTFNKSYKKSSLRTEPVSARDEEKSKYFETGKGTCTTSTSDDSDCDNILITRVPCAIERDELVSVSSDNEKENSRSKTSLNDESWNKPGPSGIKKNSNASHEVSSGDSSQDEENDDSELHDKNRSIESPKHQNVRKVKEIPNNKKDSPNGKYLARLRVRRPSDLQSIMSIDNEVVDLLSTKTTYKTKNSNKSVESTKKSAKTVNRRSIVDSSNSDSDRSCYNDKVIAAKNKRLNHPTRKSTNGTRGANYHTNRRKDLNDDDLTTVAKTPNARNGKTRLLPIEIVKVDSDSNAEDTSKTTTVSRMQDSNRNDQPSKTRNRRKNTCVSSESDSSSDSHPLDNAYLRTKLNLAGAKHEKKLESRKDKSGYRTWYTDSERRDIILYIVDRKAIALCKGEAFFQVMASEKIFQHRSASSLYNEFHKILKDIDSYARLFNLTASAVMKFKRLRGDYR